MEDFAGDPADFERELIENFRSLPEPEQAAMLRLVTWLAENPDPGRTRAEVEALFQMFLRVQ